MQTTCEQCIVIAHSLVEIQNQLQFEEIIFQLLEKSQDGTFGEVGSVLESFIIC